MFNLIACHVFLSNEKPYTRLVQSPRDLLTLAE
jgi:hypothetical protein